MCKPFTRVETQKGHYVLTEPASSEDIIKMAQCLLKRRFRRGKALKSPEDALRLIQVQLAKYEYEVFAALFLDNRHRLIAYVELFRGTIDGATVHPREVVKTALQQNAAAVIFAHNHPSGVAEPSQADRAITKRLVDALALVEVRVLDHFVVGERDSVSFAQRGLI